MTRACKVATCLVVPFLGLVLAWGQAAYKVDSVSSPPAPDVPRTLLDALQPQGTRLLDDKGKVISEVWFLKSVSVASSSPGSSDAVYPGFELGVLVGVLHFPEKGSDFRGQSIKPGYYTLRYARIPKDGNHMGVSPYPDFLLLSPVTVDTQVDITLKLEDLLKLSRQASGTPHPAVLSLVPTSQGASLPSVVQDDQGHWVVQVKLAGKGQDLPLALVLVGQASAS